MVGTPHEDDLFGVEINRNFRLSLLNTQFPKSEASSPEGQSFLVKVMRLKLLAFPPYYKTEPLTEFQQFRNSGFSHKCSHKLTTN
jgi:hypothetical protein